MKHELFYIGLTHQTAPLAVRERLWADRERQLGMLTELSTFAAGRMVLATCERFEVYSTTDQIEADPWITLFAEWFQLSANVLRGCMRTFIGTETAEHLVRVAAGLESRITGERQILGQVRNAFQFALERQSLDPVMSTLVRTAIRTGKRVRQETPLGSGSRSIVSIAMDWLADNDHSVAGNVVTIVGSGRLAALAATEAGLRHPKHLMIVGPNEARAAELAARLDAEYVPMAELREATAATQVAITCTASAEYLIDEAVIGRRVSPLVLVDLSVPRNVDPRVGQLPQVELGHLDDLVRQGLERGTPSPGPEAIQQAEQIVAEELGRFLKWQRGRQASAAIAELCGSAARLDKRALHHHIMRMKAGVAL